MNNQAGRGSTGSPLTYVSNGCNAINFIIPLALSLSSRRRPQVNGGSQLGLTPFDKLRANGV
jgi:hypothetical protein